MYNGGLCLVEKYVKMGILMGNEGFAMEMEQQFRNAVVGGFHRQDVLTYIETTVRAHAQDVENLNAQLEKAQKKAEEAQMRAVLAEGHAAELEPRAAQMEKATAELEEKRSLLAATERELRELKAALAAAAPKAEAYDAVKDKTAGIELEAHQRARQILEQAECRAKLVYDESSQWLTRVRSSYERLRTDVGATITHTAGELERAGKALAGANQEFREHDKAMKALTDTQKQE